LRNLENTLTSLERDGKSLAEEVSVGEARLSELSAQKNRAEEAIAGFTSSMEELQAKLSEINGSRDEQNRKSDEIAGRMQEIRMGILALEKDRDSLLTAVEELKKRKEDHAGRAEELRNEIQAVEAATALLGVRIDSLKKEAEALRKEAKEKTASIDELNRRRMELEKETADLRLKQREVSDRREKAGHELARLEERRDNLQKEYDSIISRLWEEYELTRREAEEVGTKIEDPPKAQRRLAELKNKIRALGPVNPGSVEEYKEVKERYDFLKTQIEDVEKSREELRGMIGDLTRQMRELFITRFRMINENFGRTFKELFGGGEASVSLSDPENILTCGIDIHVQPPGKIVRNLESLSGGEKALVAISLYFAIMRVNPPPFCVMDEIEAALDDVNVDRFANYLRRMNRSTQFIVITHRRGTMEEADVLYGVTMQDEGVSSLLELRTAEVEQKLGIGVSR
jgi:chromosome segregation protein